MSLEDRTEARGYRDIVAEAVPVDRELVLMMAGYSWGIFSTLSGLQHGYEMTAAFIPVAFVVSVGLLLFGIWVMDE